MATSTPARTVTITREQCDALIGHIAYDAPDLDGLSAVLQSRVGDSAEAVGLIDRTQTWVRLLDAIGWRIDDPGETYVLDLAPGIVEWLRDTLAAIDLLDKYDRKALMQQEAGIEGSEWLGMTLRKSIAYTNARLAEREEERTMIGGLVEMVEAVA